MFRKITLLILVLLIITGTSISVLGSSSGDEGAAPASGNSGGGGGSPQFYDYYIPLVFNNSNVNGYSEVIVWTIFPTVVITSFAQNSFGSNIGQYQDPTKLIFNPSDSPGLTNGSLIRTTAPAQVIGARTNEDISSDKSFAYSILPRRMMGFEYYAPFDGTISLLTLNAGTEIQIQSLAGLHRSETISLPGIPLTLEVKKGDYVNSSAPTIGAFYTDGEEGSSASMAVPRYLHGSTYYFDGSLQALREDEIELSYLSINPSEPTEIKFYYAAGNTQTMNIFGPVEFELSPELRGFNVTRGTVEANIRLKTSYGGNIRSSTIQLMAIKEMRAGELFLTPDTFSSHFSLGGFVTDFNFTRYDPELQQFVAASRQTESGFIRQAIEISSVDNGQFILASDKLFGMAVSPGLAGHPMDPSIAFALLPLNAASFQNITGLAGTWYRFTNLAVTDISIVPGPLEEYTGQLLRVEITANGTLPASSFRVEITLDGEILIDESFDFLQVNDTIEFDIRQFVPFGKKVFNVSVSVDVDEEVTEINEDDNTSTLNLNVQPNIRLRVTVVLVIVILVTFLTIRIRRFLKARSSLNRAHVDAILTFEEELT